MKAAYLSYHQQGEACYGLATEAGIVNLSRRYQQHYPTLKEVIVAGALHGMMDEHGADRPDTDEAEIRYAIPLTNPEKIICVGVNYPERNEEYKDGQAAPQKPSLFVRFARSFVGHKQPLVRPAISEQLDYEGEIALIIGKAGRHIKQADAYEHIAALTLCNEGSVRDWIRHGKFNVTQGKNFDQSGAMGPYAVPFHSPAQIEDVRLTTRVNGETRQDDVTRNMIFNFRTLIHYISTFTTLVPGDIIVTGTPTGAGARREPPVWLKPGDEVDVAATGLGVLHNTIADEVAA